MILIRVTTKAHVAAMQLPAGSRFVHCSLISTDPLHIYTDFNRTIAR